MGWPTVQRLGLITAVCSLTNDGQTGGIGCHEMLNLTQAHTVHVKTDTVAVTETGNRNKRKFLTLRLSENRYKCALCLLPFGEEWRRRSRLLVFSERDGNRPEVRWSIKSCSISPLWPSPSSHRSSKSFLNLTCSCWHVVLMQWFHNWPGFSRGDAYRGEEHADSWSGVSPDSRMDMCQVLQNIWRGRVPDVPEMWCECIQTFQRRGSVCEWARFNADQLLESIWCYFFWPVHPVGPVGFVPGQISAALCGLLLRIIWAVSAKCMWADGFVCVSFFLNYYFSREVFFFWQLPALANITGFYTWV